jgi:hypothetical protein
MLCMGRICSPTYFRIASCTRLAVLNTDVLLRWGRTLDLDFEASLAEEIDYYSTIFFQRWLPIILPWTINSRAFFKNCRVYSLLALWLSARTCWYWAWPKYHSLLSVHRLIGPNFLTTESDKRMHLLTRLYDNLWLHFWACWIGNLPRITKILCWRLESWRLLSCLTFCKCITYMAYPGHPYL